MSHRSGRRYTLGGKLVLLFIAIALLFILLVGSSLRHAFQGHFEDNIQPHLAQYLEYVQRDIGLPPNMERAQQLADQLKLEIHILGPHGRWSSHTTVITPEQLENPRHFSRNGIDYTIGNYRHRHYLVSRQGETTLLFALGEGWREEGGTRGLYPLAILLLILFLLYHATHWLFAPIGKIREGLQAFASGRLDARIQVRRRDELGELAESFNGMADDIQGMLDAKRELLLAISHELRSPLTRARLSAELLDDDEQRQQIQHDLHEIEALVEEILETERLSSQHRVLNRGRHDLAALLQELIDSQFADAAITLSGHEPPLFIDIDATRIRLLLKNLIENALRHTPAQASPPEVMLFADKQQATLQVRDHGTGIEPQHLPHLTEPFYRVDPARQRETGGYGLGLYLCRMIAEAHGGRLHIDSEKGGGTTVTVKLPITAESRKEHEQ